MQVKYNSPSPTKMLLQKTTLFDVFNQLISDFMPIHIHCPSKIRTRKIPHENSNCFVLENKHSKFKRKLLKRQKTTIEKSQNPNFDWRCFAETEMRSPKN